MASRKGDRIIVESATVGTPAREGEILEVIEGAVSVRYRVRWADGHETLFTPSLGSARIVSARGNSRSKAKSKPKPKTTSRAKTTK